MTTAERKKLLVLACTCDRLEWRLRTRRSQRAVASLPWLMAVGPLLSWVTPWLPRWGRFGAALVRRWMRL